MAITNVQSRATSGLGSSLSLAFLSDPTAGNLLVYGSSSNDDPTSITDTQQTPLKAIDAGASFNWGDIWYSANCVGAATTVTVNGGAGQNRSLLIAEYSGCATSSVLDKTSSNSGFGTAMDSGGAVTTDTADELLFLLSASESTRSTTFTGSFSELQDTGPGATCSGAIAERIVSATGSYQGTGTLNSNGNWVMCLATFRGAPPPPPVSAALTGTVTNTLTNEDVQAGGKTIILTLTEDTWVASGATFNGQRQNIIDGLDSDGSAPAGWDAVVKAGQSVAGVIRTSDTVVTITLDAFPAYSIATPEIVTATVPGTALTGGNPLVATPTFQVYVKGVRVGCN